jgi:hypothetical protein
VNDVSNFNEGYAVVLNGSCKYYVTLQGNTQWSTNGRFCKQLSEVGDPFYPVFTSLVLPLGSRLSGILSNVTLTLREQDRLTSPTKYNRDTVKHCPSSPNGTLTWSKLFWFFVIMGLAISCLAVWTVAEKCYARATAAGNNSPVNGTRYPEHL